MNWIDYLIIEIPIIIVVIWATISLLKPNLIKFLENRKRKRK